MNIREGKIIYIRIDEIQPISPDLQNETKALIAFGLLGYEAKNYWPLLKITVHRLIDGEPEAGSREYIYPAASPSVFRLLRAVQTELDHGRGQTRQIWDSRYVYPGTRSQLLVFDTTQPLWAEYYRLAFPTPRSLVKNLLSGKALVGELLEVQMLPNWEIVLSLTPKGYERRMGDYETVKAIMSESIRLDNDLMLEFIDLTGLNLVDPERWEFTTAPVSGLVSPTDLMDGSAKLYDEEPLYAAGDMCWHDDGYAMRFWWESILTDDYAILWPYYMGDQGSLGDQRTLNPR